MAKNLKVSELADTLPSVSSTVLRFDGPSNRPHLGMDVFMNEKLSDFVLSAKGVEYKVHRLALHGNCDKLKTDGQQLNIDEDPNLVKLVLTYVYSNSVDIKERDLEALASVADQMGVQDLHIWCTTKHIERTPLTPENCLELLLEASKINNSTLLERFLDKAAEYFPVVKQSPQFTQIPQEVFQNYILHSQLNVHNADERLSASLNWVRADPKHRQRMMGSLLDSPKMHPLSTAFLDLILGDPLVQVMPVVQEKIVEILKKSHNDNEIDGAAVIVPEKTNPPTTDEKSGEPRCVRPKEVKQPQNITKSAIPSGLTQEKCLIFIERKNGVPVVYAVKLDKNLKADKLGELPTKIKIRGACAIQENVMYITGLGDYCDEVWSFDLWNKKAQMITRLQSGRSCHGIAVLGKGQLCVFGGQCITKQSQGEIESRGTDSVEVVDCNSKSSSVLGQLNASTWNRIVCIQLDGSVVICGGISSSYIQVWDTENSTVIHHIKIPNTYKLDVYGVVNVHGHLVVIAEGGTYVSKVKDILEGKPDCMKCCDNYKTPNKWCSIIVSEFETKLMLLGGIQRNYDKTAHYVYEANVQDVIQNKKSVTKLFKSGWNQVKTPWTLRSCSMKCGYEVANVFLPKD